MGATVWYRYTVPSSAAGYQTVSVDTVGSNFNTVVAVYTQVASPPNTIARVVCAANTTESLVNFTAVPGATYFFQFGGKDGATGHLVVNVSPDSDGDGYTDIQETRLGKDPHVKCPIMRADVDYDGSVSILDLAKVAGHFLEPVTADTARLDQDGDRAISILDLAAMASHFLKPVTACP